MDFHSLARRELQALCKKNKIPANITNIAMADALKALDIVEGMEEFLNPSSVESPGKTVMASPYVPHTGGRTSVRKKTINEEPGSIQISTRARRGTRKAIAGETENAKIDVAGTPGIQSIRKRAPLASGFRKMETPRNQKEEISVQKVNTRRSTRLLEKKMTELTLNDNEGIEPIDFGGYDNEMTNDTKGNVKEDSDDFGKESEFQGMDQDIISDDLPMETARELEQISEVLEESDVVLVPEEHRNMLTPQIGKDINDEVNDVDKERNADDDILSGENLEKSQDLKDEIQEEEGCDDSGCIDNTAECLVSENGEAGFNAEKDLYSKDSADIADAVVDDVDILNLSVSAATEDQKQDIELQNQASHESEIKSMNDLESTLTGEAKSKEGIVLADDAEVEFDHHEHSICYKHLVTEKEITLVTPNCGEKSDQLAIAPSTLAFSSLDKSPSAEVPLNMPEQMSSSLPQLGSESDCLICPPSLTPLKKSSNKTPTTSLKIINLLDENKENIDNSGRKLDLTQEKGRKENNKASDSIKKKSLRQLKKIFKEKVQITNKMHINEDKDLNQVGRARPALQMLSENCLVASEPENKI